MPAPIDIQITGANLTDNFNFASKLMQQIRHISGAVDFRIQEPNNVPQLNITIDRSMASILGIAVRNTEAGQRTANDISSSTGNKQVLVAPLDLANQASISAFIANWNGPLHIYEFEQNNTGQELAVYTRLPA